MKYSYILFTKETDEIKLRQKVGSEVGYTISNYKIFKERVVLVLSLNYKSMSIVQIFFKDITNIVRNVRGCTEV